jgi:ribosomal protein L11 methyltransferase
MPMQPVKLLIANILSGPLVELAKTFAQLTESGGQIVLSGILKDQTDSIINAYQPYYYNLKIQQKEDWIRVTAQRLS